MLRRSLAEFFGTAFLVAAVVGSGIAAQRLSPGNVGLQLLENAAVTGGALVAIILALGPVSGAHLNPLISLADLVLGGIRSSEAGRYLLAQVTGGIAGAVVANLMFDLPAVTLASRSRSSGGHWLGEIVATLGLLVVVFGLARSQRASSTPLAVGAYIFAAYFFTSSTSFANPAVTISRMFSNTFSGIRPSSVPAFIGFQTLGAALAVVAIRFLYPDIRSKAQDVLLPHGSPTGPEVS